MSTIETTSLPQHDSVGSWLSRPRLVVVLYTAAFVATELIGAYRSPLLQAVLLALLAFAAVNLAVFGRQDSRSASVVMSALFAVRLATIALPTPDVSVTTETSMVGAIACVVAALAIWSMGKQDPVSTTDGLTLKKPFVSKNFTAAITIASGLPVGWLAQKFLDPVPLPIDPVFGSTSFPWLIAAGALILGALGEELLYRRLVAAMVQDVAKSQTPIISALLFAATYLGTRDLGFVVLALVAGAFWAWSCERTGSIKPVVVAHAIASILAFLILP